jgi:K+ transporter
MCHHCLILRAGPHEESRVASIRHAQPAIVLDRGVSADNIFYRLCPAPLVVPMIVLATVATVSANQSIITGAFSFVVMTVPIVGTS